MVAVKCGAHNAAGVARTFAAGVTAPVCDTDCLSLPRIMRSGALVLVSTPVKMRAAVVEPGKALPKGL